MASITFENAQRVYPGCESPAVVGLDLHINDGEFMVLVGPSGCGKTTTLRMLAGLEEVSSGRILIGDQEVTSVAPAERDIAMVFQNYALYPHMSVAENMGFALKLAKVSREERARRVAKAADMLNLTPYLERKPKALSGGQRQRVAMGRAIVREPRVFCMDEPLSNLDAKMRVQTRADIARLQAELGVTTVYVTHDQVEAMTMGDRVAVMNGGELQQVASPLDLYTKPANLFVAGFIGSPPMNLLAAEPTPAGVRLGGYEVAVGSTRRAQLPEQVTLGVRPEALSVVGERDGGLAVDAVVVEHIGSDAYVQGLVDLGNGVSATMIVRTPGRMHVAKGDRIHVAIDPADVHLFNTVTGMSI